jgi:hypothetical protein
MGTHSEHKRQITSAHAGFWVMEKQRHVSLEECCSKPIVVLFRGEVLKTTSDPKSRKLLHSRKLSFSPTDSTSYSRKKTSLPVVGT